MKSLAGLHGLAGEYWTQPVDHTSVKSVALARPPRAAWPYSQMIGGRYAPARTTSRN